jgi:hypothetical protein
MFLTFAFEIKNFFLIFLVKMFEQKILLEQKVDLLEQN